MTALRILIFPFAQIVSFTLALVWLPQDLGLALLSLFVSAAAMCFSLHISVHEELHQSFFRSPVSVLVKGLMTVLIGMPFAGYEWHHRCHHRYENGLQDYSSTWRAASDGPLARNRWAYVWFWPAMLVRAQSRMKVEKQNGAVPESILRGLAWQKGLPLLFTFGLGFGLSPLAAIFYMAHIYLGWVFVSAHNYNQHPPLPGHEPLSTSCRSRLYNALFYNNGLHFEHHQQPNVAHSMLRPVVGAPRVRFPHLWPSKVTFSKSGENSAR